MTTHKRLTPTAMAKAVNAFNARHSVGDIILCWPAVREGKPVPRTIKAPGAAILSGHTPVVYVTAGGCIALTHVSNERPDQDAAAQLAVEGVPS